MHCSCAVCSCLERGQRAEEAEVACKKALAASPGRPAARLQLARLLHGSGKHQAALATLDEGLQQLSDPAALSGDSTLALVRRPPVLLWPFSV